MSAASVEWGQDQAPIIEDLALNAWPGVQQTFYDGWVMRFSGGYTKRANTVVPLFAGQLDPEEKVRRCRAEYRRRNLSPTFKVLPFAQPPHLDVVLEAAGFKRVDTTSVQTAAVAKWAAADPEVRTWAQSVASWLECHCRLNGVSAADKQALVGILQQIAPPAIYGLIYCDGRPVACGLAIQEAGFLGIFGIATHKDYRRRGFAQRLIGHLLQVDPQAKTAYLQVRCQNEGALALYRRMGFTEKYRYWYRVSEN